MEDFIYPTLYVREHTPKTSKLLASARILLDVFIEQMRTEDNLVYFCEGGMEFYLQYCNKNLQKNYTEKTIRNAISELNKAGLLLKSRSNIYFINPLYFFKFHDKLNHKELIMKIQEWTGIILLDDNTHEVLIKKKNE